MKFAIDEPPMLGGTPEEKIGQVWDYLYKFHEGLQTALTTIDTDNMTESAAQALQRAQGSASTGELGKQKESLKSLIIKTATTVQAEMDRLSAELHSNYVANSEFGNFQQTLDQRITATAEGVVQNFAGSEIITALQNGMVGFSRFVTETNQYIKTGLLYYEEINGAQVPRYGVAVGEVSTEINADGEEILNRADLVSTFTSDKLSFWNMGVEVAYFKNAKLFVQNAEITQTLSIGKYAFKSMEDGSMALIFEG